jgi:hypothetical protein
VIEEGRKAAKTDGAQSNMGVWYLPLTIKQARRKENALLETLCKISNLMTLKLNIIPLNSGAYKTTSRSPRLAVPQMYRILKSVKVIFELHSLLMTEGTVLTPCYQM